jgi:hypothetical protein
LQNTCFIKIFLKQTANIELLGFALADLVSLLNAARSVQTIRKFLIVVLAYQIAIKTCFCENATRLFVYPLGNNY